MKNFKKSTTTCLTSLPEVFGQSPQPLLPPPKPTPSQPTPSALLPILKMVIAYFFFTLMSASIKRAGVIEALNTPAPENRFGTWEAVLFRSLPMACVCLVLILWRSGSPTARVTSREWRWLCVRGFIGTLSMACLFYSSLHAPLALVSLFANSSAFFVGILAHFFLHERLTKLRLIFTFGGFLGVFMVLAERLLGSALGSGLGLALSLMSGFLSAIAYFSVRKMRAISGDLIILSLAIWGTVLSAGMLLVFGAHFPRSTEAFITLALSSVPAMLGQLFMTSSFRSAEASLVSTGQYMGPVFAAAIGVLAFGESLTVLQICGILCVILFGVALPVIENARSS